MSTRDQLTLLQMCQSYHQIDTRQDSTDSNKVTSSECPCTNRVSRTISSQRAKNSCERNEDRVAFE
jgi:hypothetical protein